ncbi:diguanylate cyclase (GGDEF) domain-containing protein [Lachnospiraceae bacterium KH1T2]|nr:diguanylate cyclase (GGDEF) domain-containing protein [Lachnospiraceae bacterium KH1T2]
MEIINIKNLSAMYVTYLITDIVFLLCTDALIVKNKNGTAKQKEIATFEKVLISFAAFLVTDMVWSAGYYGIIHIPTITNAFIESITFTEAVILGFFWLRFVQAELEESFTEIKLRRQIEKIPVLIQVAVTALSPFTQELYKFNENGTVAEGFFYMIMVICGFSYPLYGAIYTVIAAKKSRNHIRAKKYMELNLFFILPAFGEVLDMYMTGTPVMAFALFAGIFIVFINQQESRINEDSLTRLNNRRRAEEYLEDAIDQTSESDPLYVFMIDANKFKDINDNYGHNEGDHALKIITEAIKRTVHDFPSFAGRWGGDEFVIAGYRSNIGDPVNFSKSLKNCLEDIVGKENINYNLTLSIGYTCCCVRTESLIDVIERADIELYRDKKSEK